VPTAANYQVVSSLPVSNKKKWKWWS